MRAGRRVSLPIDKLDLFADGVSVSQIGKETFKIAKRYVDDVVVVNVDEICAAIKDVFEDTRCVAEPAGALAIAGMKRYIDANPGMSHVVSIVSGANVNFDRLRHISERAEVGESRKQYWLLPSMRRRAVFSSFAGLWVSAPLRNSITDALTRIKPTYTWALA